MMLFWKIVVLVITFTMGTQAVALLSWTWPAIPNIVVNDSAAKLVDEKAIAPKGITVMYAGMQPALRDEIAYLKFIVYNRTATRLVYGSKGREWPWPKIWINGQKLPHKYRCASGMERYYIEPHTSAEFRVGVYEFDETPSKEDQITVAFYLGEENANSFGDVFSKPFVLPRLFRQAIRSWKKEQEERWG